MKYLSLGVLILSNIIFFFQTSFAQREATNWCFSQYAGLDFNSGEPVPVLSRKIPEMGTGSPSCVSDSLGNLLFYANYSTIWNKEDVVMMNGDGLEGDMNADQAVLIVPFPTHFGKYFLFTVGGYDNPQGLKYSIIDMELDNGKGAVVDKNQTVVNAEWARNKLTAVPHKNKRDYWIITKLFTNSYYISYLLTPSGLSQVPVLSQSLLFSSPDGEIKVSHDGKKFLAGYTDPSAYNGRIEIATFDNSTGIITPHFTIKEHTNNPLNYGILGIEISPDSKLLYVLFRDLSIDDTSTCFQYDLVQINDSLSFLNSHTYVGYSYDGGIQFAPDGRIYISKVDVGNSGASLSSIDVIMYPWIRGMGCKLERDFASVAPKIMTGRFPNIPQDFLYRFVWSGGLCAGVPFNFRHRFIPEPDSIHWDFGDPGSGAANTSTVHNPTHVFSAGGTFEVYTYVKYPNGRIEETSREVEVLPKPYPNLGPDTLVCAGTDVTLTPGSGFAGYYWNGSIMPGNPTYLATDTGTYIVRVKNDLGCYNADTIQVLQRPAPALDETNLSIAPTTCGGTTGSITGLQINGQPPYDYQWTASGTPVSDSLNIYHLGIGLYELHVTDGFGCTNIVASYAISDAGNILIDTASVTPAYCGNNDGTLTINAVSGLGSMLQYFIKTGSDTLSQWGNGQFAGLSGGTYYVFVTDSSGCSSVYASVLQINELTAPEIIAATSTPETGSAADGTITVNALGNSLTYSLNGATPVNTGYFTGLSAGSYFVTVTNPAGCDTTFTVKVAHETGIVLSAIAGNGFACLGKEAKAPIVVRNFKDVQSFETILNYDKLFVNCIGYSNPHPQLADSLEVTLFPASGKIQTRWKGTTPLTMSDSTEIVQLVFGSLLPGNALLLWDISPAVSNFFGPGGDTLNVDYTLGTILVSNPPQILPAPEQTVCEGGLLWVSATVQNGTGPLSYQWQTPTGPNSQETIFGIATLADNGLYELIVTDTVQCADTSFQMITVVPTPVSGFPTDTDTLYFDERIQLEAAQGYETYLWNTGDTTNSILVTAEGWYNVTISTPEGCTTTDSVMMLYAFVPLTMPNAFTPDGDLLNDVFRPVTLPEKITSFSMYIYDRWGMQVFFTNDVTQGWDGNINGSPAQIGGYVYVVRYGNPTGAVREQRGMVMVVR